MCMLNPVRRLFHFTLTFIILSLLVENNILAESNPLVSYSYYIDSLNEPFEAIKEKHFKTIAYPSINLGFSNNISWIKVKVDSKPIIDDNFVLAASNPLNDSVTAYLLYENNKVETLYFGTQIKQYKSIYMNPMAVPITEGLKYIYVKTKNHTFVRDEYKIIKNRDLIKNRFSFIILTSIVIGAMFLMLFYNIILFIKIKNYAYFFYAMFLFGALILLLYTEGVGNLFLWRNYYQVNLYIEPISAGIASAALFFYARILLAVKKYSTFFDRLLLFFGCASLLLSVSFYSLPLLLSSQLSSMFPLIAMVLTSIAAIIAIRKGYSYAKYFLIGWLVYMIGVSGRILYNIGIINYNILIHLTHYLGALIEAFVFTWVISEYLKKEKEINNQKTLKLNFYAKQIDELERLLKTSVKNEEPISTKSASFDVSIYLKSPLSKREKEVLNELSKGLTYQGIADNLFISKSTVKSHVINIYEKLGVNNRTEAINKARNLSI